MQGPYGARDVVVVEGDEETYSVMVNLKRKSPGEVCVFAPYAGSVALPLSRPEGSCRAILRSLPGECMQNTRGR